MCEGPSKPAYTAEDRNWHISAERFPYRRCERCGTLFIESLPADPGRHYATGYHPFDERGEPRWRTSPALLEAEAWRVRTLDAVGASGTLVDIGAGAGGFASAAKEGGFQVTAIEMDPDCCTWMTDTLGVQAICTDDPVAALGGLPPADVVTMWHVLEHIPEPAAVLSAAAGALRPGGVLAVAVPNPVSLQARLLGSRWAHLDAPRHVCLPSGRALRDWAAGSGLEPLLATTSDPSGRACAVHGWVYALGTPPANGAMFRARVLGGNAIAGALAPLERRGDHGAALTMMVRKAS
jgi:SAM-dependent methyltransferase